MPYPRKYLFPKGRIAALAILEHGLVISLTCLLESVCLVLGIEQVVHTGKYIEEVPFDTERFSSRGIHEE